MFSLFSFLRYIISNIFCTFEFQKKDMLDRLRDILKERGLTLKAFSEMSGISQPNLSNYINGNISPTLDTLEKIAKALNVEIQDLFPPKDSIELFAQVNGKKYRITEQDLLNLIKSKDGYESK